MDGLGQIAQAILAAAQTVDQQSVQGATKGIQSAVLQQMGGEDDSALLAEFENYKRQMAIEGRPALPFPQWKMMNRYNR